MVKLACWVALRFGRVLSRVLLLPVCLYYVVAGRESAVASRDYLRRVLQRPPRMIDGFRHVHCFAACLLDRIYLLRGRFELFDITLHGENLVTSHVAGGNGCLLFGAHFGSFEAIRAAGRHVPGLRLSLVMYEENARKTNAVLNAINPDLAMDIIALGRPGAMLAVQDRLDAGQLVGLLADRGLRGERQVMVPFLGALAGFPEGPFRMAVLLGRPVVVMFGVYRGGRRYDIFFETLEPSANPLDMLGRYVERLEHHCRDAPHNWFNFYDFWEVACG